MEYVVSREGLGYSIKSKLDDKQSDTLKNIIRQHWREKLEGIDKSKSKQVAAELETHISNMNTVVDPIEYEAFCVPNLIQHSKHMQRDDFSTYLRLIESMGVGYSEQLGKDLTSLLLIGMTSKGRSVGSAERYFTTMVSGLNKKASFYRSRFEMNGRKVNLLTDRLKAHQASLFRIFNGRKIAVLSRKVDLRRRSMESAKGRLEKYNSTIEKVGKVRSRKPTPPPSKPPSQGS